VEQVSKKFFNWASILEPQAREQAERICYQPSPANGAPVTMVSFTATTLNPGQGHIYP